MCGNDFLVHRASRMSRCTLNVFFTHAFLCRNGRNMCERRGCICILKEITIYNLSFCVCCRQEHSSSLYVQMCAYVRVCACVLLFSAVSKSSAQSVIVCCVFQCLDLSYFCARPLVLTPVEQDGWLAGWLDGGVASCIVAVANLLPLTGISSFIASRKTRVVQCPVPRYIHP